MIMKWDTRPAESLKQPMMYQVKGQGNERDGLGGRRVLATELGGVLIERRPADHLNGAEGRWR